MVNWETLLQEPRKLEREMSQYQFPAFGKGEICIPRVQYSEYIYTRCFQARRKGLYMVGHDKAKFQVSIRPLCWHLIVHTLCQNEIIFRVSFFLSSPPPHPQVYLG